MIKFYIYLLLFIPGVLFADTGYVTENLQVGIHQEMSTDSPIIKVIPSGTHLEIIKSEQSFIQVKDPEGIIGWIDKQYLTDSPPAVSLVQNMRDKITRLESELRQAKLKLDGKGDINISNNDPAPAPGEKIIKDLRGKNAELEQKFKSERLKVGEFQAKLADLRNQITRISSQNDSSEKVSMLIKEKADLENRIAALEGTKSTISNLDHLRSNWKQLFIYILTSLIFGLICGIYLFDLYNRKKHGGFRI